MINNEQVIPPHFWFKCVNVYTVGNSRSCCVATDVINTGLWSPLVSIQLHTDHSCLNLSFLRQNDVEELRNRLVSIIAEKEKYKKDYESLLQDHTNRLQTVNNDINVERETYNQSRTGLNELYLEVSPSPLDHACRIPDWLHGLACDT